MIGALSGISQCGTCADADHDEWTTCDGDCDDADAMVHPGADEVPGDLVDQNCDGVDEPSLVYVMDRYSGDLRALDRATGEPIWTLGGLGTMIGVARTQDGTLFVTQYDAGSLAQVAADGTSAQVLLTGLSGPHGLWWDSTTQTLLIADTSAGRVLEYDPATGTTEILSVDLPTPIGVFRFPDDTHVYITCRNSSDLFRYNGNSGDTEQFLELPSASDIISAAGNQGLYISSGTGSLYYVNLETLEVSTLVSGVDSLYGSCIDPAGHGVLVSLHNWALIDLYDTSQGQLSPFSSSTTTPWQCTSNLLEDADGDGFITELLGGTDCDDFDPMVNPITGC